MIPLALRQRRVVDRMLQAPGVDVAFSDCLRSLQERHHIRVCLMEWDMTCRLVTNYKDEPFVAFAKPTRELSTRRCLHLPKQKREATAFWKRRVHSTEKSNDHSVR